MELIYLELNQNIEGFEIEDNFVIGYRTRKTSYIDKYRTNRYYSADIFSTDDTECHPGLYIWPTIKRAKDWDDSELIKIKTKKSEVHKAGNKWRCRWFYVIGSVK